jgi:hypothetical protein
MKSAGDRMKKTFNDSLNSQVARFEQLKAQLIALTEIGLNTNTPEVRRWLKIIKSPLVLRSPVDIAAGSLSGKTTERFATEDKRIKFLLMESLTKVEGSKNLRPATDILGSKVRDLEGIRFARTHLR